MSKSMSKSCKCFEYTVDDGTKLFCAVDLFLAVYTVITSCEIFADVTMPYFRHYFKEMSFAYLWELMFLFLFSFTLFIHGMLGFLLYPLGWRKRNVMILNAWMISGIVNLVSGVHLLLLPHIATGPKEGWRGRSAKVAQDQGGCSNEDYENSENPSVYLHKCEFLVQYKHLPFLRLLYLLYIIYGIYIFREFKTWAKSPEVEVEKQKQSVKDSIDVDHEMMKKEEEDGRRHAHRHGHHHHHHHHKHHHHDHDNDHNHTPRHNHPRENEEPEREKRISNSSQAEKRKSSEEKAPGTSL